MEQLPGEILEKILLDPNVDKIIARFVCREWRDIIPFKKERNYIYGLIKRGHFSILKYVHKSGCKIPFDAGSIAVSCGRIKTLQYLHSIGKVDLHVIMCILAAENNHLDVLKFLHEIGCPWDADVCAIAANKGYFDIVKYAHEHGCDWDYRTREYAEKNNHRKIYEYAIWNGCPGKKPPFYEYSF